MSNSPVRWYLKAQVGVLLLPVGLCLFGEAVSRRVLSCWANAALVLDRHPQPDLH